MCSESWKTYNWPDLQGACFGDMQWYVSVLTWVLWPLCILSVLLLIIALLMALHLQKKAPGYWSYKYRLLFFLIASLTVGFWWWTLFSYSTPAHLVGNIIVPSDSLFMLSPDGVTFLYERMYGLFFVSVAVVISSGTWIYIMKTDPCGDEWMALQFICITPSNKLVLGEGKSARYFSAESIKSDKPTQFLKASSCYVVFKESGQTVQIQTSGSPKYEPKEPHCRIAKSDCKFSWEPIDKVCAVENPDHNSVLSIKFLDDNEATPSPKCTLEIKLLW